MARSRDVKIGIDYFSHDTDIMQDPKIKLLKAKHGLIGYAVYLRLLEDIYREKGYYLLLNDDVNILFCDDNNLDYNVYILILNECILRGLFDEKLYKKYGILTSKRIQLNYVSATERRLEVSFYKEYLLIDARKEYRNLNLNVNILTLNAYSGRQIESKEKVKQIEIEKEKESKESPQEFFDYWNSKKIIVHKNINTYKKDIEKALSKNTFDELKLATDHYEQMLHDPSYEYCNYTWGIHEFLTREEGYLRFLDDGSKWTNYLNKDNKKQEEEQNYFLKKIKERKIDEVKQIE